MYNGFTFAKDKSAWEIIKLSASAARIEMSDSAYPATMFDFVKSQFESGKTWEEARNTVYQRYQVEQLDGYDITAQDLYCNGCFAAGINYAASLISLFMGKVILKKL